MRQALAKRTLSPALYKAYRMGCGAGELCEPHDTSGGFAMRVRSWRDERHCLLWQAAGVARSEVTGGAGAEPQACAAHL